MDPHNATTRFDQIIEAGRFLYQRGWVPATSGNFSARLDRERAAITVSGGHKGRLTRDDLMTIDLDGRAVTPGKKPSAETLLHTTLYRFFPESGAVLHTHSVNGTVLSKTIAPGQNLCLTDYEMLKAFEGVATHTERMTIPIFDNTQDMTALSRKLLALLERDASFAGFLIRGHGLYTWGADMDTALRHVEAFEFLFECEITVRRIAR